MVLVNLYILLRHQVVNIMAMDYGSYYAPNGATDMGNYAIASAQSVYTQLVKIGLTETKIGITPM